MAVQSLIRWLLPRDEHFYVFLERQSVVAHEAAVALAHFGRDQSPAQVREAVQAQEHAGDKLVHEMEEALAATFVTPIDREDLHRLSSELDSIADLANSAARTCDLFGVDQPTAAMTALIDLLVRCTARLRETLPLLRQHRYAELVEAARQTRAFEKEADTVYREAISALFHDAGIDARRLLREKEVLDRLEQALDQCELVADTLINLAVKHG